MLDLQEHREITEAQIPNEPPRSGMNRPGGPTGMTNGPESAVGLHDRDRPTRRFNRIHVRDFHSTPEEESCYTACGHRVSPFEAKQRSLPNVCLAPGEPVSTSFHALNFNNFLGGEPLFWTLLVSILIANLAGFVIGLLGIPNQLMKWVSVVPALAAVPIVLGVLALTTPVPGRGHSAEALWIRPAIRVLGSLEEIGRCVATAFTVSGGIPAVVVAVRDVVFISLVVSSLLYLRMLAVRFGETKIAAWLMVVMYAVVIDAIFVFLTMPTAQWFDVPIQVYWVSSYAHGILGLLWGICGLVLLWKCGNRLLVVTRNTCLHCGYLLQGLSELRCPECGREFTFQDLGTTREQFAGKCAGQDAVGERVAGANEAAACRTQD